MGLEDLKREIIERFKEAVKIRLISDVPLRSIPERRH